MHATSRYGQSVSIIGQSYKTYKWILIFGKSFPFADSEYRISVSLFQIVE